MTDTDIEPGDTEPNGTEPNDKPITAEGQNKRRAPADKPTENPGVPTLTDSLPESEQELDLDIISIPILTDVVEKNKKDQKNPLPTIDINPAAPAATAVKPDKKAIPTLARKLTDPTDSQSD